MSNEAVEEIQFTGMLFHTYSAVITQPEGILNVLLRFSGIDRNPNKGSLSITTSSLSFGAFASPLSPWDLL